MLTGAHGRARHVEHVVQELECQPDPAAEGSERRHGLARLERSQLPRGREEPCGFEIAPLLVALAGDAEVPSVRALEQLTVGQG